MLAARNLGEAMTRIIQDVPDGVRMATRFGDVMMKAVSADQIKIDLVSHDHPITVNGVAYNWFYGYVERDEDGVWHGVEPGSWDSILRISPDLGSTWVKGSSDVHQLVLTEMLRVAAKFEAQHPELLNEAEVVQANNRLVAIEDRLKAATGDNKKLEEEKKAQLDIIARYSGEDTTPKP